MTKTKSQAQANLEKLPAECYATLNTTGELIKLVAGMSGFYRQGQKYPRTLIASEDITMDELADRWNADMGVTPAQREAMEIGSMWGWDVPGADPDIYSKLNDHE